MAYKHKVTQWFLNEEGYLEKSAAAYKKDPSVLYKKTEGAGEDNYTKYGKEMHDVYPSVMDFPAYWCDAFVDDGFYNVYGVANAKGLLGGDFDDYTKGSINLYKSKNAFHLRKESGFEPDEGDQVFFSKNDTFEGVHHTGYVHKVDNKKIYTVEGNTSNGTAVVPNGGMVCLKSYNKTDARIYGYGRPNYAKYEQPKKVSYGINDEIVVKEFVTKENGVVKTSKVSGTLMPTVDGLLIRQTPDYSVRSKWYKTNDGYCSAYRVVGWVKDDYGWWYERNDHNYPKNMISTIKGKDYIFDKSGYMITSSRIDPTNGNIIY